MAEAVCRHGEDGVKDGLTAKRVWTFVVQGGQPFALDIPGNPSCAHKGGRTVWKFVGTAPVAESIVQMMEALGASVDLHTEVESPEQAAERRRLLGLPGPPTS